MDAPMHAAPQIDADRGPEATLSFALEEDAFGQLRLTDAKGGTIVQPVRAFPLGAPDTCIALVDPATGLERAWVQHLDQLPPDMRSLLTTALDARDLMPSIERLEAVSTFATPSIWTVVTDHGRTQFTLRSEDDLRRLPLNGLLITSAGGLIYRIHDRLALDRVSRKLLDRFL